MMATIRRAAGFFVLASIAAVSGFAAPGTRSMAVSDSVTVLPFRVTDLEFSSSLNAIVAVRTTPSQLAIYDPESGASAAVNLPAAPTCVGVSPDGLRAIVGHNGWISEVDLSARVLVQTWEVTANVIDIIHGGNGFAYVFADDSYVRSVNLSTGVQSSTYSWRHPAAARLHPGRERIYGADRGVSPSDLVRLDISDGAAVFAGDSIYHGDFSFCGDVWISGDGLRLFTACGNTFRSSADPAQDMRFAGKLSQDSLIQWVTHSPVANSVAVLPGYSQYGGSPRVDDEIHYYAQDSLLYRGKVEMPQFVAEDKTSASRGRWHFFNAAGTKQYVVVQADSSSGIVNDYGLVTIDCTDATVSLTPSTLEADGEGGQISLDVIGSAGCAWTAHVGAEWLQTTSTGVGDGTILVNVRANTTASARETTVTVGTASATITQPPAVPGTVEPPPPISMLPFRVTDAEFSKPLNAIIAVSEYALHIFKTDTRDVTTLSLDATAFCVGVSPDGLFAAVGHSGSISYFDLVNATLVKKLDVTTEVLDVVLAGNGFVYAFPKRDQWEQIRCIQIATNTETLHQGGYIYAGSVGRLHPGGAWMYSADRGLSPADIEKFNVSGGTAVAMYDSPYHGDYSMCGDLWFSENGTRIYTACGNVFRSTADPATDMTYAGKLENESWIRWASHSAPFGSIAVVPSLNAYPPTPAGDQEIRYYSPDFFVFQGRMLLPSSAMESASWQSRGRWHFFSGDGVKQHIVVQAPPESGMLYDFGVATVDCSGAQVTLAPLSASVPAEGATIEVSVTGKPGCGWKATASNSWLNTLSSGVGDGIVYLTVAANATFSSRTGSVSIGDKTFTVTQKAAAITAVDARATGPTTVALTWAFSFTPDHYEVWRNDGTGFQLVGSPQTKSFTDSVAPAQSALVYRVRAVMSDSSTSPFVADYAHTRTFTDAPLAGKPIRAIHLEELRALTDRLRGISGAGAASYTDVSLLGVPAKLVHITQLRGALNEMRASLGLPPLTFSAISPSSPIQAATTDELRTALQ